jgi:hypothetical protein
MSEDKSKSLLLDLTKSNLSSLKIAKSMLAGASPRVGFVERLESAEMLAEDLYGSLPTMHYRSANPPTQMNRLGATNLSTYDGDFGSLSGLASRGVPVVWCPEVETLKDLILLPEPRDMAPEISSRLIAEAREVANLSLSRSRCSYQGTEMFQILDEAMKLGQFALTIPFSISLLERLSTDYLMGVHGSYQTSSSSSRLLSRLRRLNVDSSEFDSAAADALRHHLISSSLAKLYFDFESKSLTDGRIRPRRISHLNRNSVAHYLSLESLTQANAALAYGLVVSILVEYLNWINRSD